MTPQITCSFATISSMAISFVISGDDDVGLGRGLPNMESRSRRLPAS
jgi:hypothetical protein